MARERRARNGEGGTAVDRRDAARQVAIRRALSHGDLIEMTTTGRRTGLQRRIPIVFHNVGSRIYISGMPSRRRRSWLLNLETHPRLTVHLLRVERVDLPASARIVFEEAERRAVFAHIARAWRRDLETMVRYSPLIEVTIDELAA